MSEKIMGLIELAMQFKGERYANVDFNGDTKGVTVFVSNTITHKILERKICYLDWDNAAERLDSMKKDLEEILKQNKVA